MNASDRKKITRGLLGVMPNAYEKGPLVVVTPRGRILRGFCVESSIQSNRVYVWSFVQPLYVPATTIVLSLGRRLGGPSRVWGIEDIEALATAATEDSVRFFGPIDSVNALATWTFLDGFTGNYAVQTRAYSLLLMGESEAAAKQLLELVGSISTGPRWLLEVKERCARIASLALSCPEDAVQVLAEWERETVAALGVGKIP